MRNHSTIEEVDLILAGISNVLLHGKTTNRKRTFDRADQLLDERIILMAVRDLERPTGTSNESELSSRELQSGV